MQCYSTYPKTASPIRTHNLSRNSSKNCGRIQLPVFTRVLAGRCPKEFLNGIYCFLMMEPSTFAGPELGQAQLVDHHDIDRFMDDWCVHSRTSGVVESATMNQILLKICASLNERAPAWHSIKWAYGNLIFLR